MHFFSTLRYTLAGLGLAAGLSLSSCSEKPEVAPEQAGCGTPATVRLCPGKTAVCPTEHTTLELPDGTRLRPSGPLWEAYLPQQAEGQVLRIGYELRPQIAIYPPGVSAAEITCLDAGGRCGTTGPGYGSR